MFDRITLAAALLIAAPLADAGTLTVGPSGSGASFNSIHDAVLAAQAGDVILVEAGNYVSTDTIVIDKSLTVMGAGSAITSVDFQNLSFIEVPISFHIKDLAPGSEVIVSGLELTSSIPGVPSFELGTGLLVEDCNGGVVFSDVDVPTSTPFAIDHLGSPPAVLGKGVCSIWNSDQVILDRCSLTATESTLASGQGPTGDTVALAGLYASGSTVYINNSTLSAARGNTADFFSSFRGGHGVWAETSTVWVSNSTLRGGDGGVSAQLISVDDGGFGIATVKGTSHVRGGPGNQLVGGDGGLLIDASGVFNGLGGSSVYGHPPDAFFSMDNDVVLTPGLDGLGAAIANPTAGGGTFLGNVQSLAGIDVGASQVPPGAGGTLDLFGHPGSTYLTYFGFGQAPALALPGVFGEVLLDITAFTRLPTRVLDGAGQAQLGFAIPPIPSLIGSSVFLQGIAVSPFGVLSISAPTVLAIY